MSAGHCSWVLYLPPAGHLPAAPPGPCSVVLLLAAWCCSLQRGVAPCSDVLLLETGWQLVALPTCGSQNATSWASCCCEVPPQGVQVVALESCISLLLGIFLQLLRDFAVWRCSWRLGATRCSAYLRRCVHAPWLYRDLAASLTPPCLVNATLLHPCSTKPPLYSLTTSLLTISFCSAASGLQDLPAHLSA